MHPLNACKLHGCLADLSVAIAPQVSATPDAAAKYIDGMVALGFVLLAGPPGKWWEGEPERITLEQRLQEAAMRSSLADRPDRRRAVLAELIRRGLTIDG